MRLGLSLALTRLSGGDGAAAVLLRALYLSSTELTEDEAATVDILNTRDGSTITVQSGSLPTGMTLDSAARTISGTPTTVDAFSFTLRETLDGIDNSPRDTALSIDVEPAPATLGELSLDDTTVANGVSATINVLGATDGSTLAVFAGDLPDGMTLDSAARTISGTPTTADTFNFTLSETLASATNTPNNTALSITVQAELSLNDLTDVTITDPSNDEELVFSGSDWINA